MPIDNFLATATDFYTLLSLLDKVRIDSGKMCASQIDLQKKEFINSDLTMLAEKSFDSILKQVQDSKLNFQIKLSPFSAEISLKKTFIKNQSGECISQ